MLVASTTIVFAESGSLEVNPVPQTRVLYDPFPMDSVQSEVTNWKVEQRYI